MYAVKYPTIEAWVKCENRMQWVEVDEINYLEGTFVIVDADGNPHNYLLTQHDLQIGRAVITRL